MSGAIGRIKKLLKDESTENIYVSGFNGSISKAERVGLNCDGMKELYLRETGIIATRVPENVNLMRKADVQLDLMKDLMNEHALFRKDVMEHLPHSVATEIRKGFVFQGDVNKVSKEEMQLMVDDPKLLEERLKHYGGTGSATVVRDDTTVTYEEGQYWLTKIDDIYYKAWNWDCKIG